MTRETFGNERITHTESAREPLQQGTEIGIAGGGGCAVNNGVQQVFRALPLGHVARRGQ